MNKSKASVSHFALGACSALLVLPSRLAMAEGSAAERGLAAELFQEGKRLMDQGHFAEACPKLAESQRLDPGGGTQLRLAFCHENEHKVATAWAEYRDALANARRDGRADREQIAQEHISQLEPKLPRLAVKVSPGADVPGFEAKLDGMMLSKPVWGSAIPIDPGRHVVAATAPGHKSWDATVEIAEAERREIAVPVLADEARSSPAAAAPVAAPAITPGAPNQPAADSGGKGSRTAGWILGGAGVLSLAAGSYFGLSAISKRGKSDDHCPDGKCDQTGVDLFNEAKAASLAADIGFGVGIVAIGVGGYLLLSSSDAPASKGTTRAAPSVAGVRALPLLGQRLVGVGVGGSF